MCAPGTSPTHRASTACASPPGASHRAHATRTRPASLMTVESGSTPRHPLTLSDPIVLLVHGTSCTTIDQDLRCAAAAREDRSRGPPARRAARSIRAVERPLVPRRSTRRARIIAVGNAGAGPETRHLTLDGDLVPQQTDRPAPPRSGMHPRPDTGRCRDERRSSSSSPARRCWPG